MKLLHIAAAVALGVATFSAPAAAATLVVKRGVLAHRVVPHRPLIVRRPLIRRPFVVRPLVRGVPVLRRR